MNNKKENDGIRLGAASKINKAKKPKNISRIHANSLFKFMNKFEYLTEALERKEITPRYVIEDVKYLKIKNINNMAYPMICFCDINMHNLDMHVEKYGSFGIAFSKEWGKLKKIQPVQYINPKSRLREDFSWVFRNALKSVEKEKTKNEQLYENFILHEVMYYKPYEGKEHRELYCYANECEWRYIPDVSEYGYPQVIHDPRALDISNLTEVSNSLKLISGVGLNFEYGDIKYLIVDDNESLYNLVETINSLDVDNNMKNLLISKIVIWESSKEDF